MSASKAPQNAESRKPVDWPTVRAEYEAGGVGATFRALGLRHGVSHTAVRKRAEREGWRQSLEPMVQRALDAKVSGVDSTADPKKRDAAIDREAERRAGIIRRHQDEWLQVAKLRQDALAKRIVTEAEAAQLAGSTAELIRLETERANLAFAHLKMAKITAEITAIQQQGERLAHRLDASNGEAPPGAPKRVEVIFRDEKPNEVSDD